MAYDTMMSFTFAIVTVGRQSGWSWWVNVAWVRPSEKSWPLPVLKRRVDLVPCLGTLP